MKKICGVALATLLYATSVAAQGVCPQKPEVPKPKGKNLIACSIVDPNKRLDGSNTFKFEVKGHGKEIGQTAEIYIHPFKSGEEADANLYAAGNAKTRVCAVPGSTPQSPLYAASYEFTLTAGGIRIPISKDLPAGTKIRLVVNSCARTITWNGQNAEF